MTEKPTCIYVAGPMRGIVNYNFPTFDYARDVLKDAFAEAEIISPADLDRAAGFDPKDLPDTHDWDGASTNNDESALSIVNTFSRDTQAVLKCSHIALLPGWQFSKGARAELALGIAVGIKVIEFDYCGEKSGYQFAEWDDDRYDAYARITHSMHQLYKPAKPNCTTMTRSKMADLMQYVFDNEIMKLREQGQKEYAHSDDNAFANFERGAEEVGISREQILWIYAMKHKDGVSSFLKGHKSQREDVRGRLNDMIVYLFLLRGMVEQNAVT